jgi:hypothetical protein
MGKFQVVERKIGLVKDELRKYEFWKGGWIKFSCSCFCGFFYLVSGPPTTGFVVYPPMEEDATTATESH